MTMADDFIVITRNAKHEIRSFYNAVLKTHRAEEAHLATEDWLEIMENSKAPPDQVPRYCGGSPSL
ncbi:hypothetical protein D1Y84_04680 [Acidipila sp. EB88]|nr:hypothetical protein D1Y84_04680 [Acidipila sp. EB88]